MWNSDIEKVGLGKFILILTAMVFSLLGNSQCDVAAIFANDSTNAVCFDEINNVRKCYTNNIPDHAYGPFGGGNTLEGQEFDYSVCLYPEQGNITTPLIEDTASQGCGNGIIFGVSIQGVNYSPFARLYWVNPNTQEENLNFHVEADFTLNMDLNGGHVNAVHRYHYHNIPEDYFLNDLNINGSQHSPIVGYAADGFPIYYKYLYTDAQNPGSGISSITSSYQLKNGTRSGNGITAPDGNYDGTYVEDYEYISQLTELDECGGRFAITPEYPNGIYYYVLTDNWPFIPRCLKGEFVDNSFRLGPTCPASTASVDCSSMPTYALSLYQEAMALSVYPNPAYEIVKISLKGDVETTSKISSVRIYSSMGKTVYHSPIYIETIDVHQLKAGTYFIQIDFGWEQLTQKVIIQ